MGLMDMVELRNMYVMCHNFRLLISIGCHWFGKDFRSALFGNTHRITGTLILWLKHQNLFLIDRTYELTWAEGSQGELIVYQSSWRPCVGGWVGGWVRPLTLSNINISGNQ